MNELYEMTANMIVVETILVCAFQLTNSYIKRKHIINDLMNILFNLASAVACFHITFQILGIFLESL